jgi:hypothetical protein
MRHTERRVRALEERASTPISSSSSSSSGGSGELRKKNNVPLQVRSETRKMYKTLLDEEEDFIGYDTSVKTTFKDVRNQDVSKRLVKEVKSLNPSFSAADIRGMYIFFCNACQLLCT